MDLLLQLILMATLVAASLTDLLRMRIPNFITIPGMGAAVALYGLSAGAAGLFSSGLGLLFGVAVFLPFYLLGGMGAGDVKMMGAVGAFLGPRDLFPCVLFVGVVGGIYSLISLVTYLWGRTKKREKPVLRYGLAIGLGTSIFLYFK